jgi:hypothetical protein
MSDLAQLQAQALHDARNQLTSLQVEYDRLRDAILYARTMGTPGHISAYLEDALSRADDAESARSLASPATAQEPYTAHSTTISAAALAARVAALEVQLAALSDYAVHTERCGWGTRGGVCDCGLEDALKGAPTHDTVLTELSACHDLLAAVKPLVAASAAMVAAGGNFEAFIPAMEAHETASHALPDAVRAWAQEP